MLCLVSCRPWDVFWFFSTSMNSGVIYNRQRITLELELLKIQIVLQSLFFLRLKKLEH